jgi:NhaA family Na+:H+ antiporter
MVVRKHFIHPIKELAENGKLTGLILIFATFFSLMLSNSDHGDSYLKFWSTEIGFHFMHKSILHWINDGLMAIFFLMVGLEIKREILEGELSTMKQAILPVVAAFGGILFPSLIFFLFNSRDTENLRGWAIPTATDIAFSLGILTLLGNRVPFALKIFLTALAIIDDLGAILIIAIFYSHELHIMMIMSALAVIIILMIMNKMRITNLYLYLLPGLVLWYCILKSGIHPTVAGVFLALTIPLNKVEELEHFLHKPVNYIILPVFALANTAMQFSFEHTGNLVAPLSLGIMLGLFIGKPAGITAASYLAVQFKAASLPSGIRWKQIIGLGCIAGIGFTMSIFIASLSFSSELPLTLAKVAILVSSLFSAIAGLLILYITLVKEDATVNTV